MSDIDRAIDRGFRLMRFSPPIERRFEEDTQNDRCRTMVRQNYIGLFIYHCFLWSDYTVIKDVFHLDLFVHFGLVTPLVLLLNALIARHPPVWLRESLQMLVTLFIACTIYVVGIISRAPDRDLVILCLILVVLFATVMQRVQFWYVAIGCMPVQLLYAAAVSTIDYQSSTRIFSMNAVFLGIIAFSLIGAYNLECEYRRNYLLRLRDILLNKQLEIASQRDALTGLGNRRALDLALRELASRNDADASKRTAILLLDIDHFKRFNDTNGHQAGDTCIRRVATLVAGCLRGGGDAAYRFGGEEFLVLLDDVTTDEAHAVAERIRASVTQAEIPHDRQAGTVVSVSVGVACNLVATGLTTEFLVAAADSALYEAKRLGRNRVALAA